MYCNYCKKEVEAAGSICPYCGNCFSEEQIQNGRNLKSEAETGLTAEKSKAAALFLNYICWGVGGVAYLGCRKLAKARILDWIKSFFMCLTVVGIFFAIPKMCKLFISPISDLKNIFSDKVTVVNDSGEIIIWK